MDEAAGPKRLGRLRTSSDFQRTFKGGRRVDGPLFLLVAAANQLSQMRLGLAVGRGVGGAVVRNRAKRLMREAFRHRVRTGPTAAFDIVIVAKPDIQRATLGAIAGELERRFSRLARLGPSRGQSPSARD